MQVIVRYARKSYQEERADKVSREHLGERFIWFERLTKSRQIKKDESGSGEQFKAGTRI